MVIADKAHADSKDTAKPSGMQLHDLEVRPHALLPASESPLTARFLTAKVLELLGVGNSGVVHRARHKTTGQVVALKVRSACSDAINARSHAKLTLIIRDCAANTQHFRPQPAAPAGQGAEHAVSGAHCCCSVLQHPLTVSPTNVALSVFSGLACAGGLPEFDLALRRILQSAITASFSLLKCSLFRTAQFHSPLS